MTAEEIARAASFLRDLNEASEKHGVYISDTGGHDKQLSLVLSGEVHGLFGTSAQLRWVEDHYEIETY
jgi:hypothetical protein